MAQASGGLHSRVAAAFWVGALPSADPRRVGYSPSAHSVKPMPLPTLLTELWVTSVLGAYSRPLGSIFGVAKHHECLRRTIAAVCSSKPIF